MKILLVDDEERNLKLLIDMLLPLSHTLLKAMDGKSALEIIRQNPDTDLVLLDIMMPDMDGYEVCTVMKADNALKDIPIILITALSDETSQIKGIKCGAVDYVTKPFKKEILRARVNTQLELKQKGDALKNTLNELKQTQGRLEELNLNLENIVREKTKELLLTQEVTIESMGALAEYRDKQTGDHIRRTKNYVRELALYLKNYPLFKDCLDDKTIEMLYLSAPLHDIGKVGIPDSILLKPGKLTEAEFAEMKNHTIFGRDILAESEKKLNSTSFLRYAKVMAGTHHEKWDGTGYPCGLKGKEIPLPGRLMALADVYDALISKRPYKEAFSHEKAAQIIKEGRGTHFDPDIVDAFLALEDRFKEISAQRQQVGQS